MKRGIHSTVVLCAENEQVETWINSKTLGNEDIEAAMPSDQLFHLGQFSNHVNICFAKI